jgi:hypothetical protein
MSSIAEPKTSTLRTAWNELKKTKPYTSHSRLRTRVGRKRS